MATSKITYNGGLRTTSVHLSSGKEIVTDAPVDNKGKGEAFSPTDLLATSLGNCMLTIVGIAANEHGFNIDGATCEITKIMAQDPRRVGEIMVNFQFPDQNYSEKEKKIIERSANTCPVFYSLHPDLIKTDTFPITDQQDLRRFVMDMKGFGNLCRNITAKLSSSFTAFWIGTISRANAVRAGLKHRCCEKYT
eukprot:gene3282-3736_t